MKRELSISVTPTYLSVTVENTKSLICQLNLITYYGLVFGIIALHLGFFQCSGIKWLAAELCILLWAGTTARKEAVTLTKDGCQLRTVCVNGLTSRNKYLPLKEISDIVINEGIVCYSSELYLAFVQSGDNNNSPKRYHVLFGHTKLDRKSNTEIYHSIKDYLNKHKTN